MRAGGGREGDSVGRRLGWAFGLLTGLILLVGAGALTGSLLTHSTHERAGDRLAPTLADTVRLRDESVHMQRSMRGYLITGDLKQLDGYFESRSRWPAVLASARAHGDAAADRSLATQARELAAYVRVADQQARVAPRSDEAARLTRQTTVLFDRFEVTNRALETRLSGQVDRTGGRADAQLDGTIVATGVLAALAVAVAVWTAVRTTRALTHPLHSAEHTLGRLAAGDHEARAEERGPQEIRAVARSVNLLADEGDRLRDAEEERRRLSDLARQTGIRIRDRLDVDYVLDTACSGIGEALDADYVFVLLAEEDGAQFPVARVWSRERGLLPEAEAKAIPSLPADVVRDHYRRGAVWLATDLPRYVSDTRPMPGAPGSFGSTGMPTENRAAAAALGLDSAVITPIGVGEEPIGAVSLARTSADHPWRPVDIEIAESMASGVGRALHTALLYEQETTLVEKLRALDKAKSDFLSTVSHELRTPLTSIVGYIELLKDEDTGPLSPPQRRMLDVVDRNANRLRALIEDLLTLSRIESGAFSSKREPIDLRRLVASAADAMKPTAEAASVTLETHCPERPLVLEGDGEQLDRVLMNLLSNAVKFTPQGGTVSVRADRQDGEAVLSVSDTGIGIPAKEQEKLFTRFFRASNATDAAIPGTGLGLTIVRTIVANHGGDMYVHSEEGQGTTITARLPITETDGAASPS
ncbi:ATP-binding protein [Streptomyces sp. HUAS ZL42]|uniref:ATP-binding protein n=1 Tax=Streptomyces sp. HUAS ZL42 TaxID=3231715 RepID=UPI00345ECD64